MSRIHAAATAAATALAASLAAAAPAPPPVDASTLRGKHVMGYQGWFSGPGDGARNGWGHWFRDDKPDAEHASFDLWPDVSELDADEVFPTALTLPNGKPAMLYSPFKEKTVVRHFEWMQKYNIDGVVLQRFSCEVGGSFREFRDQVTRHVRAGAEKYGRIFCIMYDISGQDPSSLVERLKSDWMHLVDDLKVTESSRYVKHRGKPVACIWGFGFNDRPGTPEQARELIAWFKTKADPKYRVTLLGGVPTAWRSLGADPPFDSQRDPAWAPVYRSFDVINPWGVGRCADEPSADVLRDRHYVPDMKECRTFGADYMPVVFPGFSWHNLKAKDPEFKSQPPLNQIPRRGGAFYWRQVYNVVKSDCTMLFSAMFDEADEGTAMWKTAPTKAELPAQGAFVPLDIDGYALPGDWYLRLAGEATKALRGQVKVSPKMPLPLPAGPRKK